MSFVAAGIGVALVPASIQHLRITGAVYRPLEGDPPRSSLAVAKAHDDSPHIARILARAESLLASGEEPVSGRSGGPAAPGDGLGLLAGGGVGRAGHDEQRAVLDPGRRSARGARAV